MPTMRVVASTDNTLSSMILRYFFLKNTLRDTYCPLSKEDHEACILEVNITDEGTKKPKAQSINHMNAR
jgi:hypothetical protein